ncbi:AMP-dependent acyl-CoA synthetase [Spongiactinospora gelatinilytica]|uniref:AMP-dependent acyl-CoA synthetase n=2 Tax=Spongiactinospora gelatinilytica TaxID=2666298 RepID=A0A2W2H3V2_9ACTN|nr:AMP-dependent acyl-CoA synthetase [Spongiactinospora gelatinilytica]
MTIVEDHHRCSHHPEGIKAMIDPATTLRETVSAHGDALAVVCDERRQTYAEMYGRACRLANALRDAGIEPGDRVAVLADNDLESIEIIAGLALGGYVNCPLYTHHTAEGNAYLLNLIEATALIVQARHHAALAPLLGTVPGLRLTVVIGEETAHPRYTELLAAASADDPKLPLKQDDTHVIRFSAGTTGRPKGIVHDLKGWMAMGDLWRAAWGRHWSPADRYLATGPISHATGLLVWPVIEGGAGVVVMRGFDPGRFLELAERERATVTLLVPTMVQMVLGHPDVERRDVSSMHTIFYGAAPMPRPTLVKALSVWGPIMYQAYGQSEALPISILRPEHHILEGTEEEIGRLRSAGRPCPGAEVRIADDEGGDLPAGEIGEIVVRTPGAMSGLWKDPEGTAARITPDGYMRTRDMGYLSPNGFLYLTDRKDDMIISGGFNIWPAELESALLGHPAVREATVVGVPHEKWGETPHAIVVLGDPATESELIDFMRAAVGSTKKPTAVHFAGELPKTPLGKVLRRAAREAHCAGCGAPPSTGGTTPSTDRSA